jgi:hypothetical protein
MSFPHSSIRQADNGDGGQAVRIVYFHFDDDAFKANDSAGIDTRKRGGSLDEAE